MNSSTARIQGAGGAEEVRSHKNLLFVSPRQCWPMLSGAHIREYRVLKALGEAFRVTYVFFQDAAVPLPGRSDLPFCEHIVPVPRPTLYSPLRILKAAIGRWPLPVVNYTSEAMAQAIRQIAREQRLDYVHFDSTHLAAYVDVVSGVAPDAQVWFDWHNIESEALQRYAESSSSRLKAQYARIAGRKFARVERDLLRMPHGHIVCSARERDELIRWVPNAHVEVVRNGVDVSALANLRRSGNPHRVLFVGHMAYHANASGILWFATNVWPAVRNVLPDKRLTIVGARPPEPVQALSAQPDIEVAGTVPEVAPYYEEAVAAVVPLHTGSGTRLKILEAMAARVPVISTTIGAEGLDVCHGRDILIADTPEEWTKAFETLRDQRKVDEQVDAGFRLAAEQYDWSVIERDVAAIYQRPSQSQS